MGAWKRWSLAVALMLGLVGACEQLPPLDYQSEHALVGTNRVDRVCAGTLARIDRTIEYVDHSLGRRTDALPTHVYIVDPGQFVEECERAYAGCVSGGEVFLHPSGFDHVLTHEIVHAQIARTEAAGSKPLFNEGIAVAIGEAPRPPTDSNDEPPSLEQLLETTSGSELYDIRRGYYHAGELTAWLLETEGVDATLAFMAELDYRDGPDEVRSVYTAHFGRSLDDDDLTHLRNEAGMTAYNVGCTGPTLAPEPSGRFRLQADLACESPRVENLFSRADRVFVEWVIRVDEADAGAWAPVRRVGDDRMPADTFITFNDCTRAGAGVHHRWTPSRNEPVEIGAGQYRVRWHGPMDGDAILDLELGGPCGSYAQGCPAGELCTGSGICVPAPD